MAVSEDKMREAKEALHHLYALSLDTPKCAEAFRIIDAALAQQPESERIEQLANRVEAAIRTRPLCRDCADEAGRCPQDGELCSNRARATEIADEVRKLYTSPQPTGNPND